MECCEQHCHRMGHYAACCRDDRSPVLLAVWACPVTIPKSQYAALPYRRRAHSLVEILLVTSRDSGRWVIPKGWPIPGLAAHNSAAREAMEEGGVLGQVGDHAIGIYHYNKRLAD